MASTEVTTERTERMRSNKLYCLCRPFVFLMRIGGIFFIQPGTPPEDYSCGAHCSTPQKNVSIIPKKDAPTSNNSWKDPQQWGRLYCLLAFTLMVAYFVKSTYSYCFGIHLLQLNDDPLESTLATYVTNTRYLAWVAQMVIVHVIFLRACANPKGMFKLFISWEKLRFHCPVSGCTQTFDPSFIRKRNVVVILAGFHLIVQYLSVVLAFVPSDEYSQLFESFMRGFNTDNVPVKILIGIASLYSSSLFILPSYFFLLIGSAITIDFLHFDHDLRRQLRREDGRVRVKTLEWFRLRHNALCILLEHADWIFSPWILLTFGCSIVQILSGIFSAYAGSGSSKVMTEISTCYWILTYFLHIAIMLYVGASVNSAALAPTLHLYEVNQSKMTFSETLQLQTFLSKLTCDRIGFTAWKMFTVDFTAVVEVVGLYVTHQILLFQLQLDLGLEYKAHEFSMCEKPENNETFPDMVGNGHASGWIVSG
ncbi:hypothetical protein BV898_01181 [Hypsibius exemplaris]|uniref:Gustatory receptor n=1 Tax=Hypsibius exemplaris TaxID=2072580 RepID=A0A1W0XCB3_HYPEX|nr:hypothetical protein BV898_01181 [Hypsibius exemplaris]